MLPFSVQFARGEPASEQVVHAVRRAFVSGQLRPGERFPSVRTLSQELRLNPNTAHKIVAALTAEGLLEVIPGVGTVVAAVPASGAAPGELDVPIERLVVAAKRLALRLEDVQTAVARHWQRLEPDPLP